ncbi:MAG: ABC transporter permease [Pseudomonadales bacterium]|jgi:putative ABC transport system permease protein|nr:ABC transporter permease [Pseudomonadales bacterium]MDP7144214.1 ABC transporter permease [Pseudomonadales bacterium]MDP7358845.1 ABC transporter permease [Pseudomonadales bacterium]MDP7594375.1 ABC transporter permease [Pseudomonadales bacterium]|tara:strand:+ start:11424 stop:13853 length:2430 start_codon:yes stop_codon:yes gene_type:complete
MLKHYLKVTLRHFYREKTYALINVLGLSLAIACALILFLYIRSELTYDQHNVNHERIYRIANVYTTNGKSDRFAASSHALGPLFLKEFPQVGEFVRFRDPGRGLYRYEDTAIFWTDVRLADENAFRVFTHKAIYGDLENALADPFAIALSESFSRAYFGDRNPVGEKLKTDVFDFRVTAVFEDQPDNSHLKYDALISMNVLENYGLSDQNASPQQLFSIGEYTYIFLSPDLDQHALETMFASFYDKVMSELGKRIQLSAEFITQPLAEVHFDSSLGYDELTGNVFYVYGFFAVAVFVVLVACINYTNLATARATKRAKEIGMRKIIGAERWQLIVQFMGESVGYALVALLLGGFLVVLAEAFTPLSSWLGKGALLDLSGEPLVIMWIVMGTILIGVLAGIYPALYLSSVAPLSALTATKRIRSSGLHLREILIFLQFLVSVGVLASTVLMQIQMRYVASKPLGYDEENKLSITLRGVETLERILVIRNELLKNASVLGFTESSYVPGQGVAIQLLQVENNQGQMERTTLNHIAVGKEFIDVMDIEVIEGRDFSKRLLTDVGTSVVVNETMVKNMGWENPIGKRIQEFNARVVGVVEDFHFASLHEPVVPMFLRPFPPADFSNVPPLQRPLQARTIIVSVAGEDVFRTINYIDSVISEIDPEHPFEFRFFDDLLNEMYENETNLMHLTSVFAGICMFISCLGLFGVAAFTTELRTKEIGIRKVIGATTLQIITMLARNLMYLVVVASVLASLLSYYVMNIWLDVFAYRVDIEVWVFIAASLVVAAIAFTTIAAQSSKTALSNPVNALRYE